jgi:Protein of unknown function (DUF4231)
VRRRARSSEQEDPWDAADPALALALQQLDWYARRRNRARITYETIELLLLVLTAITTVAAALRAKAWITATLAAATVVLAGLTRVLDSHDSWIASGSAWAELQVAINDYRLLSADQREPGDEARTRLIAKVNETIKADTGRWASRRRSLAEGADGRH